MGLVSLPLSGGGGENDSSLLVTREASDSPWAAGDRKRPCRNESLRSLFLPGQGCDHFQHRLDADFDRIFAGLMAAIRFGHTHAHELPPASDQIGQ